jgi:RNA polymerase sigma-70 factor (ECF subfamily)
MNSQERHCSSRQSQSLLDARPDHVRATAPSAGEDRGVMFNDADLVAQIPRLTRYANRLAGNNADDLLQDVLLRALNKRHLFHGGDLRAWLFTVMHNTNATRVRNSAKRVTVELNEEGLPSVSSDAEVRILVKAIVKEIERLPGYQGRPIKNVVDGMSYAEAARREGVLLGTVRSRIARGRAVLREFAA